MPKNYSRLFVGEGLLTPEEKAQTKKYMQLYGASSPYAAIEKATGIPKEIFHEAYVSPDQVPALEKQLPGLAGKDWQGFHDPNESSPFGSGISKQSKIAIFLREALKPSMGPSLLDALMKVGRIPESDEAGNATRMHEAGHGLDWILGLDKKEGKHHSGKQVVGKGGRTFIYDPETDTEVPVNIKDIITPR